MCPIQIFDTLDDFYVHMPTWCWQIYLTSWCKCLEYPLLVANIVLIIFILELRISRSWYLDSCGTSMLWRFQQDVSRWSKKYRCSCNCQWLNGIEDPKNLIFVTQSPKASHFPMCFFVFSDGISVFFFNGFLWIQLWDDLRSASIERPSRFPENKLVWQSRNH